MTKYVVLPGFRFGASKQFGPGDVVELAPEDAASFLDKLAPLADEPAPVTPVTAPDTGAVVVDNANWGRLAENLKLVRVLQDAGYRTPGMVQMATDEELLALDGIGPKSLAVVREVLGGGEQDGAAAQ